MLFKGMRLQRYASPWTQLLTRRILGAPLKLFGQGLFSTDQIVDLLGESIASRKLRMLMSNTDVIVYSNFFSIPPPRLLEAKSSHELLVHHEYLGGEWLPPLVRLGVHSYVRRASALMGRSIAITERMARSLAQSAISTQAIPDGFQQNWLTSTKPQTTSVIVDSRWHRNRQPLRLVNIASRTPKVNYLMLGRFQDPSLKDDLQNQIRAHGLGDRVILSGRLSEQEYFEAYSRAHIVLRWAVPGTEDGFPLSLVYAVSAGCVPIMSSGLGATDHLAKEVSPDLAVNSDEEFAATINRLSSDSSYYLEMKRRVDQWRIRRPWSQVAQEMLSSLPS